MFLVQGSNPNLPRNLWQVQPFQESNSAKGNPTPYGDSNSDDPDEEEDIVGNPKPKASATLPPPPPQAARSRAPAILSIMVQQNNSSLAIITTKLMITLLSIEPTSKRSSPNWMIIFLDDDYLLRLWFMFDDVVWVMMVSWLFGLDYKYLGLFYDFMDGYSLHLDARVLLYFTL